MKVVAQRVARASVRVDGVVVGSIGRGILALVGVTVGDAVADAAALADKLASLRVFPNGQMERTLTEVEGAVLVVSQFTLYADTRKGRRPSFTAAAPPDLARPLVQEFADRLARAGIPVETGTFGASMEVELVNQGPVTIILETQHGRLV